MASLHIKKGDLVQVISGKDRGTTGRVLKLTLSKVWSLLKELTE